MSDIRGTLYNFLINQICGIIAFPDSRFLKILPSSCIRNPPIFLLLTTYQFYDSRTTDFLIHFLQLDYVACKRADSTLNVSSSEFVFGR